jgi:hypothetical protein
MARTMNSQGEHSEHLSALFGVLFANVESEHTPLGVFASCSPGLAL